MRGAEHLHDTGHGYWPVAVALGIAAALVALVAVAWNGWRGSAAAVPRVLRLGGLQAVAFTVLELTERAAVGLWPLDALASPEFVVGLLLQFVVAAVTVVLLRGVERVAAAVAPRTRRRRSTRPSWTVSRAWIGRGHVAPRQGRPRAPPLAV